MTQQTYYPAPPGWHFIDKLVSVGLPTEHDSALIERVYVTICDAVAGWGSGEKRSLEQRVAYGQLLYPYDTRDHMMSMETSQSSCATAAGGVMERIGAEHKLIDRSYWGHTDAVSKLIQIARELGILVDATKPSSGVPDPEGVCICLVGNNGSEGGEHVFSTLQHIGTDETESFYRTSEGGQPDPFGKGYSIQEKTRVFDRDYRAGQIWSRGYNVAKKSYGTPKRLQSYFPVIGLKPILTQQALVPDGF